MFANRVFARILSSALLVASISSAAFSQDLDATASGSALSPTAEQAMKQVALAQKLTKQGNKNAAIERATEAAKLCPNWGKPLLVIAQNLMDTGKWEESIKYCQAAIRLNRNDEEARATLTSIYFRAYKPFEAISTGQDYLRMFPRGCYREQVSCQIEEAEHHKKTFLAKQKFEPGTNYLAQTTDREKSRWQSSSMPLRVYFDESASQAAVKDQLGRAFWQWQQSSKGYVSFVFVNDPRMADIDCTLKNVTADNEDRNTNIIMLDSTAKFKGQNGGSKLILGAACITHASMQIATPASNLSAAEQANRVQLSAMHQIGHCLGIIGHSNAKPDLMHEASCSERVGDREAKLNERDINTLLALYHQEPADYIAETSYSLEPVNATGKRRAGSYLRAEAIEISESMSSVSH